MNDDDNMPNLINISMTVKIFKFLFCRHENFFFAR